MSDVSTHLGAEATFEWQGTTYTLVPWDRFGIQKQYTAWLKARAWREAFGLRADPEFAQMADHALTCHLQSVAAGDYGWKGKVWTMAVGNLEGIEQITYLTLQQSHPAIKLVDVQAMLADEDKGAEIGLLLKSLVADPNAKAPPVPSPAA